MFKVGIKAASTVIQTSEANNKSENMCVVLGHRDRKHPLGVLTV